MTRKYCENETSTRRQREDTQATLRNLRHTETLAKKRTTNTPDATLFPTYTANLLANDTSSIFQGVYEFRTLLSTSSCPPIDEVLRTNLLPRFVELLSANHFSYENVSPDLVKATRLEAAWVLTNIASGTTEHTSAVVECGAIPLLLDFALEDEVTLDQCVWALGNIAGDSEENRNAILKGDTEKVLAFLDTKNKKILKNVVWLVSNLCRGKDEIFMERAYKKLLELCRNTIQCDKDTNAIITDSLWGIAYSLSTVPELCTVEDLIFIYSCKMPGPLVRISGNLTSGKEKNAMVVVEAGGLPFLNDLYLVEVSNKIKKEICWTFSNLCVGKISKFNVNKFILPVLLEGMNSPANYVRIEAGWGISNLLNLQNKEMLNLILQSTFFSNCSSFLRTAPNDLLFQILCGIKRMLMFVSETIVEMESCGVFNVLEEFIGREDNIEAIVLELLDFN